jgi:hypothetical protein
LAGLLPSAEKKEFAEMELTDHAGVRHTRQAQAYLDFFAGS